MRNRGISNYSQKDIQKIGCRRVNNIHDYMHKKPDEMQLLQIVNKY